MVMMTWIAVTRTLWRMCLNSSEEVQCSSCLGGSDANYRSHCVRCGGIRKSCGLKRAQFAVKLWRMRH